MWMSYAREKNLLNFKLCKIAPVSANIYRLINLTLKLGDVPSIAHMLSWIFFTSHFLFLLCQNLKLWKLGEGKGAFPQELSPWYTQLSFLCWLTDIYFCYICYLCSGYISELKNTYQSAQLPVTDDETILHKFCVKLETVLRHEQKGRHLSIVILSRWSHLFLMMMKCMSCINHWMGTIWNNFRTVSSDQSIYLYSNLFTYLSALGSRILTAYNADLL